MRDLTDIFKALADETRLMMLVLLLQERELCVCDFVGTLKISQSKASRHLQKLKHAGFLSDRPEGLWVHYQINKELDDDHKAVIRVLRKLLGPERVKDLYDQIGQWLEKKNGGNTTCCDAQCEDREIR